MIKTDSSMRDIDNINPDDSDESSSRRPSPKRDSEVKTFYNKGLNQNGAGVSAKAATRLLGGPEPERASKSQSCIQTKQAGGDLK